MTVINMIKSDINLVSDVFPWGCWQRHFLPLLFSTVVFIPSLVCFSSPLCFFYLAIKTTDILASSHLPVISLKNPDDKQMHYH